MESLVDLDWQNSAAIKSLLDSQGWKILKERISSLWELEDVKIKKLTKSFVTEENLKELNYRLAKQQAYQQILNMEEELFDEVDSNSPPSEGVQNTSGNE